MNKARNYEEELRGRVAFIQGVLKESKANAIVFGNSGGKDSALVAALCKAACQNVIGVMLPCQSSQNFGKDMEDGQAMAQQFGIESLVIDLTSVKKTLLENMEKTLGAIPEAAKANIAPRLRMTALYTMAQSRSALVAGTGNKSERYMGYFTKWGDGACDFNPIGDLTVKEVYEFLEYLNAPESIITKAPSAGLFEGQTDEAEMGITYANLDQYLLTGECDMATMAKVECAHNITQHKRELPKIYGEKTTPQESRVL